jgi:hypothetical protein
MEMINRLRGKVPDGGTADAGKRLAASPGFFKAASEKLMKPKVGGSLAGLALLGSVLNASQEFDGEDVGLDASQASGRFLGDFGTTGALALAGGVVGGPLGAVALPAVAGLVGVQDKFGQAGANMGGGIYSALTGVLGKTEDEKAREKLLLDRMNEAEIFKRQAQLLAPVQDKLNEMQLERRLRETEALNQIQSRYNYRNSLDQQSLLNSQNSANLSNILASTLY